MTRVTAFVFTLLFVASHTCYAGKLDQLEESSTQSRTTSSTSSSSNDDDSSLVGDIVGFFFEAMAEAMFEVVVKSGAEIIGNGFQALANGGSNSLQRYQGVQTTTGLASLHRESGDPLLPRVSLTSHWLSASDDINAQLNRVELGYGLAGLSHTQNTLTEKGDSLTLSNTLIHYRMSFTNDFSWDFALGRGKMNGNQVHQGSVFAMPMRLRLHEQVHLEYFPTWSSYGGGKLSEHQISLNWHYKHVGITTGYKKWSAGLTTVEGFFTGLNFSL